MKIAFVGVKRKYQELAPEYRDFFNQYHLELPYYFARDGRNKVLISTIDYEDEGISFDGGGYLVCSTEDVVQRPHEEFDVVVHWRKWFPELYRPEAINVINCQDHSFSAEWQAGASQAFKEGKLYGILCFPHWHKKNLLRECPWLPEDRTLDGVTLGVDTDIYRPVEQKNPREMLWASDPGRGLQGALQLALQLFQRDRGFRLHVCYPDYCPPIQKISHPAIVWQGNVPNGPRLWDLFNWCGTLPYTCTFMEPSSRAHRQAQAAGSMVLYPPGMGTPSDLIRENGGGIVAPINEWVDTILENVNSGAWQTYGQKAREVAVSENWAVQAQRFNRLFEGIKK